MNAADNLNARRILEEIYGYEYLRDEFSHQFINDVYEINVAPAPRGALFSRFRQNIRQHTMPISLFSFIYVCSMILHKMDDFSDWRIMGNLLSEIFRMRFYMIMFTSMRASPEIYIWRYRCDIMPDARVYFSQKSFLARDATRFSGCAYFIFGRRSSHRRIT